MRRTQHFRPFANPTGRTWTLALVLLLAVGLAGCAEPEEEEGINGEEEAVGEEETPGFGVVALLGGAVVAAALLARLSRR